MSLSIKTSSYFSLNRINTLLAALAILSIGVVNARLHGPDASTEEGNSHSMQRHLLSAAGRDVIKGSYFVVFDPSANMDEAHANVGSILQRMGGRVEAVLQHALSAVLVRDIPEKALDHLLKIDRVQYIEADQTLTLDALTLQSNPANWGINRVDQLALPLDSKYYYQSSAGRGVVAFILDSGIRVTHTEFSMISVFCLYNAYSATEGCLTDGYGHGTSVASTVAGKLYGAAKNVTLGIAKVFDSAGAGGWGNALQALDAVVQYRQANPNTPCVVNLSFSGGYYQTGNNAVANAIASGVTVTCSAGNDNGADACVLSPGSTPGIVVVGSTDSNDKLSSFSNDGTCLSVYAPGGSVKVATKGSDTGSALKSGTSFSAPLVAGIAALHLSLNPQATPADIKAAIEAEAAPAVINAVSNRLANTYKFNNP